jgi:hypothetical protein
MILCKKQGFCVKIQLKNVFFTQSREMAKPQVINKNNLKLERIDQRLQKSQEARMASFTHLFSLPVQYK